MNSLYIVMPAYNEELNIEGVVKEWSSVLKYASSNSRIVVAPSGSNDGTIEKLRQLQKEIPQLEYISTTNRQHGPKLIALYEYAVNAGADYIFQTDSDGQTTPADFLSFWEKRQEYDAILGYRTKRMDGKYRKYVSWVLRQCIRLIFNVNIKDANVPFRLISKDVLSECLKLIPKEQFLANVFLSIAIYSKEYETLVLPVTFKCRVAGENSINILNIHKIGSRGIKDLIELKKAL